MCDPLFKGFVCFDSRAGRACMLEHVSDSGERLFQVIIYCYLWATKPKCPYWTWNERPTIFLQNAPLILQFGWWSAHTIPAFTLLGFRLIKQALNFPSSFIQTLTSPQTWISNLKKKIFPFRCGHENESYWHISKSSMQHWRRAKCMSPSSETKRKDTVRA